MNLKTIRRALSPLFQIKMCPLIIGSHGVGKSTSVREYTEQEGIGFIDLRLGQMEVGDLLGLPEIVGKADDKRTVFARPKWFPTEGKGILFLDEINRAKRDVLQAVFQLVLDRKLHDYTLPDGWQVVAAINPSTEDYQVTEFDKALNDRFCHIKVTSSYLDFIGYGNEKGFNKSMLSFISNHPGMLRGVGADFNLNYVTPSDRSWEFVSRLTELFDNKQLDDEIYNELMVGIVGLEASTAYLAWKKTADKPVDGMLVLDNYKKVQKTIVEQADSKNYRPDLLNDTKQSIVAFIQKQDKDKDPLSDKQYENLIAFMLDLPNDLFIDFNRQFFKVPKLLIRLAEEPALTEKIELCLNEKGKSKHAEEENVP